MSIERVDPDDASQVAELMALDDAIRAADQPLEPSPAMPSYVAWLRYGWDGEPPIKWGFRDGGRLVGQFGFSAPKRDNRHMAHVGVGVHPDARGKGLGKELFARALDQVRAENRRLLVTGTLDAPGPRAFAERCGFERASVDVHRRQDLHAIDWDSVAELNAKARDAAAGYSLLRFVGPLPAETHDDMAALTAAINDAPTDDLDVEDEVFDAQRIRDFDHAQEQAQRKMYRLVARRDADGALAGHTIIGVELDRPGRSGQYDTSVLKEHRGHRLGLLLKSEMMMWLRDAEPDVRWVDTGNAESNSYMISINEALGYRIVARYLGWQRPFDPAK